MISIRMAGRGAAREAFLEGLAQPGRGRGGAGEGGAGRCPGSCGLEAGGPGVRRG